MMGLFFSKSCSLPRQPAKYLTIRWTSHQFGAACKVISELALSLGDRRSFCAMDALLKECNQASSPPSECNFNFFENS